MNIITSKKSRKQKKKDRMNKKRAAEISRQSRLHHKTGRKSNELKEKKGVLSRSSEKK